VAVKDTPSNRSLADHDSTAKQKVRQVTDSKRMNSITRWNPLKDMEELHRRLSSVFDLAPSRGSNLRKEDETMTVTDWSPLVDITEDEKEYVIKADLPEVKKEDVKVTVENGIVNITGERKLEKEEKGKRYHRIERAYGSFVRSFSLPDDADASKVNAEFKDGLLKVRVAKSETARPKQIEVKVS